jgi:aerobic-type carbon monoxide dehydrogenase small subunit (CoxS/CutS family)
VRLLHAGDAHGRPGAGEAEKEVHEEIRVHISGNYCRCTGYQAIVDAIESVVGK